MNNKEKTLSAARRNRVILSIVLTVICIIWILPVLAVVINSFKVNTFVKTATFALPLGEMWAGFKNFISGITLGNYNFWQAAFYSLFITVVSTALILLFCSMAAWYIARVNSTFCKIVYYVCVFSMVIPFQMVMFTLSKTADTLKLNTPWTIPIIYLGFGAGLAVFMFTGFVKSIPLEIEEAAVIDGANKFQRVWYIDLPLIMPTVILMFILAVGNIMTIGYEKAWLMQAGGNTSVSEIISTYVYKTGLQSAQYSFATAVGLFNSVVNFVILVLANLVAKKTANISIF